jgi:hypothetical protein
MLNPSCPHFKTTIKEKDKQQEERNKENKKI